jgi:hypothetical protein
MNTIGFRGNMAYFGWQHSKRAGIVKLHPPNNKGIQDKAPKRRFLFAHDTNFCRHVALDRLWHRKTRHGDRWRKRYHNSAQHDLTWLEDKIRKKF